MGEFTLREKVGMRRRRYNDSRVQLWTLVSRISESYGHRKVQRPRFGVNLS